MRRTYSQSNISLTVNGHTVSGFAEGTSITITLDGGEVQKTQGTDGPSINRATGQGATVQFSLRETSSSFGYMLDLFRTQEQSGNGVTAVMRTGSDVLYTLEDCFVSNPAALTTGDKTQGAYQFTLMSLTVTPSNTSLA